MTKADSRTRDQLEDEDLRETQGSELYFIIIKVPGKLMESQENYYNPSKGRALNNPLTPTSHHHLRHTMLRNFLMVDKILENSSFVGMCHLL